MKTLVQVIKVLLAFISWIFGCHHGQLSRVFTIDGKTYRVCCNCGSKFDYSLDTMSMNLAWELATGD